MQFLILKAPIFSVGHDWKKSYDKHVPYGKL